MKNFVKLLIVNLCLILLMTYPMIEQMIDNNTYLDFFIYRKDVIALDIYKFFIYAFSIYLFSSISILFYYETYLVNSIKYFQYRCKSSNQFFLKILKSVFIIILKNIIIIFSMLMVITLITNGSFANLISQDTLLIYLSTVFISVLFLLLSLKGIFNNIVCYLFSVFIFTVTLIVEINVIFYFLAILILFIIYYIQWRKKL